MMRNILQRKGRIGSAGLSLVELIISMAILAVVGTAIGGAMYVSSRSFSTGSSEVNVQEEAQISSNLICDWLVDATSVTFDAANDDEITIVHKGIDTIRVYFDDGKLKYTATEDGGGTHSGDLASNVTGVKFGSTFETDRNVTVSVDFLVNGRTYHAVTDTTSRNFGFISNGGAGSANPIININDLPIKNVSGETHYQVYIEPGQTGSKAFKFDAVIYNWDGTSFDADPVGSSDVTLAKTPEGSVIHFECTAGTNAGLNSAAARVFKLEAKNADGSNDIKYIDVYVRRVNKVYFNNGSNDKTATPKTGEKGKKNTVYEEEIDLGLQNWEMNPFILAGKYDIDIPYIDPSQIAVSARKNDGTVYSDVTIDITQAKDNGGKPKISVKLTEDLSETIYIVIAAPHAGSLDATDAANKKFGVAVNNKSAADYTIQGRYYAILKIEGSGGHFTPFTNVGGGLRRGAPATTIARFDSNFEANMKQYLMEHYKEWLGLSDDDPDWTWDQIDAACTYCSVIYYRPHRSDYDIDEGDESKELDGTYSNYFVLDNVRQLGTLTSDYTGRRLRDSASSIFRLNQAYDVKVEIKVKIGGNVYNCGYTPGTVPAATAFFYDQSTGYFSNTTYGVRTESGVTTTKYLNVDKTTYSNGTTNGWDNCLCIPAYIDSCIMNSQVPKYVIQKETSPGHYEDVANQNSLLPQIDGWAQGSFTLGSSPINSASRTFTNVMFDEDHGFDLAQYQENNVDYNGCNVEIIRLATQNLDSGKNYRIIWRTTYNEMSNISSGTICADCTYSDHNGGGSATSPVSNDYNLSASDGTYGCLYIHCN